MHLTTPLFALIWLASNSNAAPQLRTAELSIEGASRNPSMVVQTASSTSPLLVPVETGTTSDGYTSAAGEPEQQSTQSSPTPEESATSSGSSTTTIPTPSSVPQPTQGTETTFAMSALAQPAPSPPVLIASVVPQAAGPPAGAAAAVTTPPPQVPSFEEAYGNEYMQTTYWSCNTFALTTACGWHEPIIYIGGAKSSASRSRGGVSGVYGSSVVAGSVAGVVAILGLEHMH